MSLFQSIKNAISNYANTRKEIKREQNVISKCGCVVYCCKCKDILNDQATLTLLDGKSLYLYECSKCNMHNFVEFGIAPVPLLLDVTFTPEYKCIKNLLLENNCIIKDCVLENDFENVIHYNLYTEIDPKQYRILNRQVIDIKIKTNSDLIHVCYHEKEI